MKFSRIDIHTHLNFDDFDVDRDLVTARALDSGTAFINVGTDLQSSKVAAALAEKHPEGVYAIVGLHPIYSIDQDFDTGEFRKLLASPKVVGIGECGLDYFRLKTDSKERQKQQFEKQIALGLECKKPLMLHIREAYEDALDILRAHPGIRGNSHFFAGTTEVAQKFLDIGFTVSFTGVITFAQEYEALVKYVPIDMMQVETDAPYVAPAPYRGTRNEPANVSYVTRKIAEIKSLPLAEVEAQILANSRRVWGVL